jgi:glycosyltransferase involved in cell wall biosynthesis
MKITYIIPTLSKGGAERVTVELANQAVANGHAVTLIQSVPADPALQAFRLRPEINMHRISAAGRNRIGRYIDLGPWLWRNRYWLLDQDVIHCHLTLGAVAGTAIAALRKLHGRSRPRVIETNHAVGMPVSKFIRAVTSVMASGRDGYAIMAQDSYWQKFADRHPKVRVEFIPNGVSLDEFGTKESESTELKSSLGIPADSQVVGTIGRIVRERQPLSIVAAFAEIGGEIPGMHFIMGGQGEMSDAAAAKARRLGIGDRFHLPGLVKDPRVALAAMDLYISVNVGQITGIAGLEAAAAGLPVIAVNTRRGYDGRSDWIWSSTDPTAVGREAIRLLLSAKDARATADRQCEHVRKHHTPAAMFEAYQRLYSAAG